MNRRQFLQGLTALATLTVIPPRVLHQEPQLSIPAETISNLLRNGDVFTIEGVFAPSGELQQFSVADSSITPV